MVRSRFWPSHEVAPRPASEASWTWLDEHGQLVNYDPSIRDLILAWYDAAVDTALSFGYFGA